MIKHIWAVYFSPSGKTEQVTMAVAEGAAGVLKSGEIHVCDLTLPDKREHPFCFGEEDLVIFGCPTYAGRIPNKIMPFIRDRICGHGASAAIVMTTAAEVLIIPSWRPICCCRRMVLRYMAREVL